MSKSVSVVIPTYNYGRFIDAAIQSALNQTEPAAEIIVVDDGSSDNTAEIVSGYNAKVKYVQQENQGVCAARNRGVREAESDLIAFLDADDFWEPTILERQRARFDEDSEIGLVHTGMREFDGDTGETIRLHLDGGEDGVADNLLLWEGPVIVGPGTVAVSRDAFNAVGGFDTRMKVGEDWDFCYRVARRFKVAFVPEPLLNYRTHPASAHLNVENMEAGMSMFYEKAFATDDSQILRLRRRAYGNFHKVMAGSYLQAGNLGKAFSHGIKSIWMTPANIGHLLRFPFRRLAKNEAVPPHA